MPFRANRVLAATPEARQKVARFFHEWLRIDELATGAVAKDTQAFPQFSQDLRAAMVRETELFVDRTLFEDEGNLAARPRADL